MSGEMGMYYEFFEGPNPSTSLKCPLSLPETPQRQLERHGYTFMATPSFLSLSVSQVQQSALATVFSPLFCHCLLSDKVT